MERLVITPDTFRKNEQQKGNSTLQSEISQVIGTIPFEKLSMERTPFSGRMAWRGPQGFGFKVTGCFFAYHDGSHVQFQYSMPHESTELYKAQYAGIYPEYLKEADGDEDEALAALIDDEEGDRGQYEPLRSFVGRWLVLDRVPNSSPSLPSESVYDSELPISIEADPQVWYESETYLAHEEDISPDSPQVTSVIYDLPINEVFWLQEWARPTRGGCKVELVELPEQKPEFFVPESSEEVKLWLPKKLEDQYKGKKEYQPSIGTYVHNRQRPVDKKLSREFVRKEGDYALIQHFRSDLVIARRKNRIVRAGNSGNNLVFLSGFKSK